MSITLNRKKKEFCIAYEEGDLKAKFYCVKVPEGKIRRITQKNLELKDEENASVNLGGFSDDKLDATIKRWEGIEYEDGKPIPCTRQNKIMFYEEYPEVIDEFLLPELEKILEGDAKKEEEDVKN